MTEDEMRAIAEYLGSSIGELRIQHTRIFRGRVTLRDFANGDCTFLDGKTRKCMVYPVRPAQCRTWPFWNSNLESRESWDDAKKGCPGMDCGELVQLETIQQRAAVVDV